MLRWIGKGTAAIDLQIIGGFAMTAGLLLRLGMSAAMKRGK
jgi:hypothetical protein